MIFSCPECQSQVKLADAGLAGQRVRCPHCAAVIQAPRPAAAEEDCVRAAPARSRATPPLDDAEPRDPRSRRSREGDDDDVPRRRARHDRDDYDIERRPRRRLRSQSGGSSVLILCLLLGGAFLVVGGIVLAIFLASSGGGGGRLAPNKGANRVSGRITPADRQFPPGTHRHAKEYPVHLEANKLYVIDMMSQEFDAFLHLLDPAGREVAAHDDGGEGLNSRIVFRATQTGDHRIVATTCGPHAFGSFVVSVIEQR